MTNYNALYSLFKKYSFTEILGDGDKEFIQVHDAIQAILSNYALIPNSDETYEYGYLKDHGSSKVVALIGDEKAFKDYKFDVENSLTHPGRTYFRRPKETRTWEELPSTSAF